MPAWRGRHDRGTAGFGGIVRVGKLATWLVWMGVSERTKVSPEDTSEIADTVPLLVGGDLTLIPADAERASRVLRDEEREIVALDWKDRLRPRRAPC